ncbi:MAG: helix-turn-helix transcriptional regulator [Anaerolineae bacterium]|nr:helix-turn-helix transcriptional regulator [Anaerolineae bacterium]
MIMATNLSTWLTQRLQQEGWSMRELARRANISHTWVNKVINEESDPSADFCIAIAKAFHIAPEDLMRIAGVIAPKPNDTENPTLREIWSYLRTMDHEQLRAVREFVRFQSATGGNRGSSHAATNKEDDTNTRDATPPPPTLTPDPKTST